MQTVQSYQSIESCFPLMAVVDDCIISKRGDITLAYRLTLPHMYSLTESGYDDILLSLSAAVKSLPEWTLVHLQNWYTHAEYSEQGVASDFLSRSYDAHFQSRRYLRHQSYLFLTFSSRASALRSTGSSGLFGIKAYSAMPSDSQVKSALDSASDFVSVLTRTARLGVEQLDADYLLGSGSTPGLLDRYLTLDRDDFLMSDIGLSPSQVQIDGKSVLGFSISETDPLPGSINSTLKVDALSAGESSLHLSLGSVIGSSLDCDHIVNHYILTCNQAAVMQELDRKRRRMTSMQRSSDNRIGAEEIQKYMDAVQTDSLTSVRSHLNILAWGEDPLQVKGKVAAALSIIGISGVQNTCDTPLLWYAGLPGAGCELGEDNLMLMELRSSLALGIYESFEKGIDGGRIRLCDRTRHIPIRMDIQERAMDKGYIGNMNAIIIGGSGTGKSFTTNSILHDLYSGGESVFIIDVGDSYQGLCSLIHEESSGRDGFYHSWDKDHPLTFSAFQGWKKWLDPSGSLVSDNNSVNFIISFLKTLWSPQGGWNSESTTVLVSIIQDFLVAMRSTYRTYLIMDDFYRYLSHEIVPQILSDSYHVGDIIIGADRFDIVAFALALQPYSKDGTYGFLLNGENPEDIFSSRFTVFEVDQLSQSDPKFYSLCILCIMNAFDIRMRESKGTKVMVIEEAWKAIANETMAPYLASLWKTARKFRTSAVVVTQQISDILSSDVIRDTILKNSDVKVLLDQSSSQNRFDEISGLLGLSPHDKDLVLSINRDIDPALRYKEVFISLGEKYSGVYAVEVSPQEALAYESDKQRKAPLLRMAAEKDSIIAAIKDLCRE